MSRTHSLETGTWTTKNSSQYSVSISHNRCWCISRYLHFPARSTLGWFCFCSAYPKQAVRGGTHDNKSCAWARWDKYCLSAGCRDIFMNSLSKQERRHISGYFSVHSLTKWSHGTHHLQKCPSTLAISLCHNWKCLSWLWAPQSRNSLSVTGGSNGDVSWGSPCLHNHAPRQVVKRHFPSIHPETGWTILVKCCEEDDNFLIILSFPRHCSSTDLLTRPPAAQPL